MKKKERKRRRTRDRRITADRSTVAGVEVEGRGDESYRCVLLGGLLVGDGGESLKNGRRRRRRGEVRRLPPWRPGLSLPLESSHDVTAAAPVQATDGTAAAAAAESTRQEEEEAAAVDRWSCTWRRLQDTRTAGWWFGLVRAICQRR